ncbi:Inhibin beta C chain [Armadillidium nasatum]|uniref:Inhibin beta C chain n=1 Tax=Armadillidium nasatum TaxID=96803 RepID=A0A5N5SXX4_9CRUS|nr:Inhibin beta C chain [Armadillidium nasatum]
MLIEMSAINSIAFLLIVFTFASAIMFPVMSLPSQGEASIDTHNNNMNFMPVRAKHPQKCPWCQGHQESSDKSEKILSQEDIRLLRIELVKAKILARLNLTEAPNGIKPGGDLPSIIKEGKIPGIAIETDDQPPEPYQSPSIIVAESNFPCSFNSSSPSYCFTFQLENVQGYSAVSREALLWLWKSGKRKNFRHHLVINQLPTINPTDNTVTLILQIVCQTCSGNRHSFPISNRYDHRPFIVTTDRVTSSPSDTKNLRLKRSTDECINNNQRCCRDSLYVDFAEFGWNNWILQPAGFTMHFCRGSCNYITTATTVQAGNSYRGLLQRLMLRPNMETSLREALAPCCSSNHKEPLTVLWLPGRRSSYRVTQLQDMIVKSCDCFG